MLNKFIFNYVDGSRLFYITLFFAVFGVSGCAGKNEITGETDIQNYHREIAERDTAVAFAVSEQQKESYKAQADSIKELGQSTNPNASMAIMALALQKPDPINIKTQSIERPVNGADYVKALAPVAGVFGGVQLGGKIVDGLANGADVINNYKAGGDIKGSGNYNKTDTTITSGGDTTANLNNAPCQGNKCQESDSSTHTDTTDKNSMSEDVPNIDSRGSGACTVPAIYKNGIFYYNSNCSCLSHEQGHC